MNAATSAAGLWASLLIVLLLVLSWITSANRRKHSVSLGDGGNPGVTAASRAFGNAAEYCPALVGALILLAVNGFPTWTIHLIGGGFFAGRILHAWGLLTGVGPTPGRMIGMLLTYIPFLASAVLLIWSWGSAL